MKRERAVLVCLAMGAVGLMLGVWSWLERDRPAPALAPAQPATQLVEQSTPLASQARLRPLAASSPNTASANASPMASAKPNMAESDWAAFDREWCVAVEPMRLALQKSGNDLTAPPPNTPAVDDSVFNGLGEQLLQRLARALAARASPRDRAVGLWLAGKGEELMAEVEATRDPVIAALAAQRLGEPMRGRAIRLWRALEPSNMVALLYAQEVDPQPTPDWFDALSRATSYDTHIQTVFQIAYSVPPPTSESPSELALQMALVGLHAAFPIPKIPALIRPCRQPESASFARQCARVAERMWALKPNDTLMPRLAVSLVRSQPALHPAWESRAQQVEAVAQLVDDGFMASITDLVERLSCLPQSQPRGAMNERLRVGDWVFWTSQLPAEPAKLAALSERFRQRQKGKGLLATQP
jgi:hypothetical protein